MTKSWTKNGISGENHSSKKLSKDPGNQRKNKWKNRDIEKSKKWILVNDSNWNEMKWNEIENYQWLMSKFENDTRLPHNGPGQYLNS